MTENKNCPVHKGQKISRAWWKFDGVVASTGEPLQIGAVSLIPVMYDNGDYALLRHVAGDEHSGVRIDQLTEVRPGTFFTRLLLRDSASMPQVLPGAPEGVVQVSVEQSFDDAEEVSDGATVENKTVCILNLFGVVGSRNGHQDTAELFKVSVPSMAERKWA